MDFLIKENGESKTAGLIPRPAAADGVIIAFLPLSGNLPDFFRYKPGRSG